MKIITYPAIIFCVSLSIDTTAQSTKQKVKAQTPVQPQNTSIKRWSEDSLQWPKGPKNKQITQPVSNQSTQSANQSNKQPDKTKLDDLKNPFDTTKKMKSVRPANRQ